MIEPGDPYYSLARQEFWVKAGPGKLGTDKGQSRARVNCRESGGDVSPPIVCTVHVRIPRPTDFFAYGSVREPYAAKDIGLVIAYTGMNHNDDVLDAGTAAGLPQSIWRCGKDRQDYEIRPEFSMLAMKNITESKLTNVEAVAADFLAADGEYDVVHLDLQICPNM